MIKEFKAFIAKGNVVDLAVAVIIGSAFALVVKSFTDDILGQLLAAVGGKPNFNELVLPLRTIDDPAQPGRVIEVGLRYGAFLTAIVNFLIVGFALFVIVKALHRLQTLRQQEADEEALQQTKQEKAETEIELLRDIRDLLGARAGGITPAEIIPAQITPAPSDPPSRPATGSAG